MTPIESEVSACIDRLSALWGKLDANQTNFFERDELKRCTLARVRAQQENNRIFAHIRATFGIPDNVPITAFPRWLDDALKRIRLEYFREWEQMMTRKMVEAEGKTAQETTVPFIGSGS